MFSGTYDGILNPTDGEITLYISMMTELCRLRGTPAIIETENSSAKRMVLIDDNPTSRFLKNYGFNNHSDNADEMICHVALVEDDPLLDFPPIIIKAGNGEGKMYRVDGVKITFDKRYFMTLILLPYSKPSDIKITTNPKSVYGSEGRVDNISGKDCDVAIPIPDIIREDLGDSDIVTGKDMITKRRFGG